MLGAWSRCRETKGRRLSDNELGFAARLSRVLETSVRIVQEVGQFLVDVPGIMILTERTGAVLRVTGEPLIRELAATRSGIVEGSQWNELTAGTNGLGTALAEPSLCMCSRLSISARVATWSCAASPIFDTDGHTVLGIIDFTTVESDFRDQALGLTVSVANSIQARMALHRGLERRRLLTAFSDASRHYPHDDVLALDHAGRR